MTIGVPLMTDKGYVCTSYTHCAYLTGGKAYAIELYDRSILWITNDKGHEILIISPDYKDLGCVHLGGIGKWEWCDKNGRRI